MKKLYYTRQHVYYYRQQRLKIWITISALGLSYVLEDWTSMP
jgi:hypothetical protein